MVHVLFSRIAVRPYGNVAGRRTISLSEGSFKATDCAHVLIATAISQRRDTADKHTQLSSNVPSDRGPECVVLFPPLLLCRQETTLLQLFAGQASIAPKCFFKTMSIGADCASRWHQSRLEGAGGENAPAVELNGKCALTARQTKLRTGFLEYALVGCKYMADFISVKNT
jgi:hypothetical protein